MVCQEAHTIKLHLKKNTINGDTNVNILVDCNEYNFTFLQRKALIKAVNLLKAKQNATIIDNNNSKNNSEPKLSDFVYVSRKDESVLNEVGRLGHILKNMKASV